MSTRHTQAPALAPWGVEIGVDAGIVPFIEALWALGIDETRSSCQDDEHHPGMVMVGIDSAEQMQKLMSAAYDPYDGDGDLLAEWDIVGWTQPGDPILIFDVHIPHDQIAEVTRRLIHARDTEVAG